MFSHETKIGAFGESIAVRFLKDKGYLIISRNRSFHAVGEIDIICVKNGVFHFVEVKTSAVTQLSELNHPLKNFNLEKKERLKASMKLFSREKRILDRPRQLDLIGVNVSCETGKARVIHQENVCFEDY